MVNNTEKTLVLSGVQPTGNLHLGNYLGAIRNWVKFQGDHPCLFMLADLHAITVFQDPAKLRQNVRETAAAYIACGIDPKTSIIFPQSAVPGHSELAWILGCHTPLGWLFRMTQFKDKAPIKRAEVKDGKLELIFKENNNSLALLSYPALMAADILLYKSTHVPVGHDQKQHLELARDIAGAFNRAYSTEFFPLPEPLILGAATRVMSLRDGTKKMSKSDESDYSRIHLTDSADVISQKIKKATTDAIKGMDENLDNRPEALNLLTIYSALSDIPLAEARVKFANSGFGEFKKELTDVLIATISPISSRMNELLKDSAALDKLLLQGAEKAREMAEKTMKEVKALVGFQ